jgi:hypothetical protein
MWGQIRFTSVVATLCVSSIVGAAHAHAANKLSSAEIFGRVHGEPSGAPFDVIEAINARGVIARSGAPNASGQFRFFLHPGTYIVVSTADNRHGQHFDSASVPLRARTGKRVPVGLHLRKVKTAEASRSRGPVANGAVVSVGDVKVVDAVFGSVAPGANLRPTVINRFLNLCSPQGTVMVQTDAQFVAYAKQEAALSRAGKLSTPFDYKPLKAQFTISGQAEVTRSDTPVPDQVGLTVKLQIVELKNGRVVAKAQSGIPDSKGAILSEESILNAVSEATRRLAIAGCGANPLIGG